ncbi:MAG: HD domain-containing protein [Candidatus Pacebacteria bacterium]|nr:HD domain-containing protein [Candidatus Paceibacterota bacterium]
MKESLPIPASVLETVKVLENKGFPAYIVGGSLRDLLLGREPKDWDIATSAKPEEIEALYPKTFYNNSFGTVTVVNEEEPDEKLKNIEITPFRLEGKYTDFRHPDEVTFSNNIEDDLKRRDFTINAIAYRTETGEWLDPFGGIKDLKDNLLRAVGEPEERFKEDPLRVMRGIRLSTELNLKIEPKTAEGIKKMAPLLDKIAVERIREELEKLIMSRQPMAGLKLMAEMGVMEYVIRETLEGLGVEQNGDHIYDVWEHTLRVLQHSADREWPLHVRLAALFHDVGKPRTRRFSEEKKDYTFYGHEVVGAKMAKKIMERLKFPMKLTETVEKLVRNHMFFTDIDKITLSAVRRIVAKVGAENVWDLMKVRACDRIGMGRPKEAPYRLRKYESMIEEAMRAPTSVTMLKIDGGDVIRETGEKPGPRIGFILHALLEEVLETPELNTKETLLAKAKELAELKDEELKKRGEAGKEAKEEKEEEELAVIRKRHGVK